MNIDIGTNICFKCGKEIAIGDKDKHHAIPKTLKPKFNVKIPVHRKCHIIINELYVSQQKKPIYDKLGNVLDSAILQLTSIHDKIEEQRKKDGK